MYALESTDTAASKIFQHIQMNADICSSRRASHSLKPKKYYIKKQNATLKRRNHGGYKAMYAL